MMMMIDRLLLLLLMIEIYFIIMIFIDLYQHEIFSEFKMLDLTRFITYRGDDIIDNDVLVVDQDD